MESLRFHVQNGSSFLRLGCAPIPQALADSRLQKDSHLRENEPKFLICPGIRSMGRYGRQTRRCDFEDSYSQSQPRNQISSHMRFRINFDGALKMRVNLCRNG
jgi:hypothetical protein